MCCDGLVQANDYCDGTDTSIYCTIEVNGGSKYYWCPRETTVNCGTQTLYMTAENQTQSGTVTGTNVCEFEFTTTDAVAATSAAD
mmetsp:Transcript_34886/g.33945  ORF Transcript_34886/g.33945 Transcript_34886/m.33945 type:complete len:85 (+) Transcript_34886:154-408(+)